MQRRRTRRSVAGAGERALIARLGVLLPKEPRWVAIGRGEDDCAALDLGGSDWTLVTCDAQVEGTHFERAWIDARTLGRRAAAVNLSDIAAMGGEPRAAVVSLLLRRALDTMWYEGIMRGLGEHFAEQGTALVGGNLARASRHIVVDVTLLGRVRPDRCVRRRGAQPGDRVLVTGHPGESAAGLARLRRGGTTRDRLRRRFLDPQPRVAAGQLLAAGGVTAMIDLSDGISRDVGHLCRASDVGVRIDVERLPVTPLLRRAAEALGKSAFDFVLHGGEDYELLCTAPPRRVPALQRRLRERARLPLTEIGEIRPASEGRSLHSGERRRPLEARGFEHFG